jgi:hypothetical protein
MTEFDPFNNYTTINANTSNGNAALVIGALGVLALVAIIVVYKQTKDEEELCLQKR